jgi:hypothetical protein
MNTTTPLKDFATLADARNHTEPHERMLSPDMVINFLTVYNSLDILLASTDEKAKGLVFALQSGVTEFNLMSSHPVGQLQQQLIGYLVQINAITVECFNACVGYANTTRKPYANETKQNFDIAKGAIERKSVTVEKGFCTITTTADCEKHNPQVYRKVTFNDGSFEYVRVAGFRDVELAKTYRIQCPSFPELYVDNAYGVVS